MAKERAFVQRGKLDCAQISIEAAPSSPFTATRLRVRFLLKFMIENIRKYTGLTMVVLVILFISFLFLDSHSMRQVGGNDMFRIADRTYSDKEYQSLGAGGFDLANGLASSGDFGIYQFLGLMSTGATSREDAPEKFFVGRMILRQAKEEYGVYPGEDEISAFLKSLRAFSGADQKFDVEKYSSFIEKGIGRLGLTEKDVRELASDVLASEKINRIVGSGLAVDRAAVAKNLALENQQITGEIGRLALAPYEEKIQPTEEQIKTYWDVIQDAFTTEPKRKFTYVIITPSLPTEPAPENETPTTIVDEAATPEAKAAADKVKEAAKAKRAADFVDQRRKKQLETDALVSSFFDQLGEKKGASFEELAKEKSWEVKTTELFTKAAPPAELDLNLRASANGGKAADLLFQIQETKDPFSKISVPIAIGENQWLVARMDGEEKSRAKTFDEARAEARAQYISEKAVEALKAAATEAATKIRASLTAGKSFAEAAKDAGITETKTFSSIISTYRPEGATEPQNLFAAARTIDPGALAEPIVESDRAFILHVTKREVVKEANAETRLDSEVKQKTSENETFGFTSWLAARVEAAKVETLYKQR